MNHKISDMPDFVQAVLGEIMEDGAGDFYTFRQKFIDWISSSRIDFEYPLAVDKAVSEMKKSHLSEVGFEFTCGGFGVTNYSITIQILEMEQPILLITFIEKYLNVCGVCMKSFKSISVQLDHGSVWDIIFVFEHEQS